MRIGNLYSRLRALEKLQPDPSKRLKAILPAWLVEEIKAQGFQFDASGRPILSPQTASELVPCE